MDGSFKAEMTICTSFEGIKYFSCTEEVDDNGEIVYIARRDNSQFTGYRSDDIPETEEWNVAPAKAQELIAQLEQAAIPLCPPFTMGLDGTTVAVKITSRFQFSRNTLGGKNSPNDGKPTDSVSGSQKRPDRSWSIRLKGLPSNKCAPAPAGSLGRGLVRQANTSTFGELLSHLKLQATLPGKREGCRHSKYFQEKFPDPMYRSPPQFQYSLHRIHHDSPLPPDF